LGKAKIDSPRKVILSRNETNETLKVQGNQSMESLVNYETPEMTLTPKEDKEKKPATQNTKKVKL